MNIFSSKEKEITGLVFQGKNIDKEILLKRSTHQVADAAQGSILKKNYLIKNFEHIFKDKLGKENIVTVTNKVLIFFRYY